MSFKDLTARAAAALKPTPVETAENPPVTDTPKADAKDAAPKPKAP